MAAVFHGVGSVAHDGAGRGSGRPQVGVRRVHDAPRGPDVRRHRRPRRGIRTTAPLEQQQPIGVIESLSR